jgi:arsenite methyltransferase
MDTISNDEIRNSVRESYGKVAIAENPESTSGSSCCGAVSNTTSAQISAALGYSPADIASVPEGANMGLGCGNPQAIASLKPGETVLDLGSGGGFDAFLAAQSVGKSGYVIGVDMTAEMITKARNNAKKAGRNNVDFRLGEMEYLPVENDIVDVIISNCVINLSPEKEKVFSEAYRVLKPGGRLAISDVVALNELPDEIKKNMEFYSGCISGASTVQKHEAMLIKAGFESIEIKPKGESADFIRKWAPGSKIEDFVVSATIEAVKPKE